MGVTTEHITGMQFFFRTLEAYGIKLNLNNTETPGEGQINWNSEVKYTKKIKSKMHTLSKMCR